MQSPKLGVTAGSSVRNLAHWAQGVRLPAPTFQMFDWGKDCSDVFFRPQPCNSQVHCTVATAHVRKEITTNVSRLMLTEGLHSVQIRETVIHGYRGNKKVLHIRLNLVHLPTPS